MREAILASLLKVFRMCYQASVYKIMKICYHNQENLHHACGAYAYFIFFQISVFCIWAYDIESQNTRLFPLTSQPASSFLQRTNQDRLLSHPKEGRVTVTGNNWWGKEVRHPLLLTIFSHPRFVKCHPYTQELEIQRGV